MSYIKTRRRTPLSGPHHHHGGGGGGWGPGWSPGWGPGYNNEPSVIIIESADATLARKKREAFGAAGARGGLGALTPADVTQSSTGSVSGTSVRAATAIIAMQQAINLFGKGISTDGVVGQGTLSALQSVLSSLGGGATANIAAEFGSAMNPPTTMFVAQHADDYARLLPPYAPKAASGPSAASSIFNTLFNTIAPPAPAPVYRPGVAPAPVAAGLLGGMSSTVKLGLAAIAGLVVFTIAKRRK